MIALPPELVTHLLAFLEDSNQATARLLLEEIRQKAQNVEIKPRQSAELTEIVGGK